MRYSLAGLTVSMKTLPGAAPTIADIELPQMVAYPDNVVAWIVLGLIIVVLIIVLAMRFWRSRRWQAMLQLRKFSRLLACQQMSADEVVFEIAALLRARFAQRRLSPAMPLPVKLEAERQRWHAFVALLDKARYEPPGKAAIAMDKMMAESKYWLSLWR